MYWSSTFSQLPRPLTGFDHFPFDTWIKDDSSTYSISSCCSCKSFISKWRALKTCKCWARIEASKISVWKFETLTCPISIPKFALHLHLFGIKVTYCKEWFSLIISEILTSISTFHIFLGKYYAISFYIFFTARKCFLIQEAITFLVALCISWKIRPEISSKPIQE